MSLYLTVIIAIFKGLVNICAPHYPSLIEVFFLSFPVSPIKLTVGNIIGETFA